MPRKPLNRSQYFPYHVVNRCNNREWFSLPMDIVWRITCDELYRISILYEAQIHALTLMSNLVLSTPGADLGIIMADFGKSITQAFNRESGRSGHLFTGRYKWSQIRSPIYYANALKYLYRNPVRAGIVENVEDYAFSTLSGLLGRAKLPFPLFYPRPEIDGVGSVPKETDEIVAWFNQPFNAEILSAMDLGFRRLVFELPRDQKTGKIILLDHPSAKNNAEHCKKEPDTSYVFQLPHPHPLRRRRSVPDFGTPQSSGF